MTRDKNWERFWSTGSVFDYLAYKENAESNRIINQTAVSCITEANNEVDHTGSDCKGTDCRRKR